MSSRDGRAFCIQIFGESHGPVVGVTLDGLPAGILLDENEIAAFLKRRAAAGSPIATGRKEEDLPHIVSGLKDSFTTGYPLTALFYNKDAHSADYGFLPDCPRPGHADYPAIVRSHGYDDLRGSGHHSGRLTLPYTFAGAVAIQVLSQLGMEIYSHVVSVGDVKDDELDPLCPDTAALKKALSHPVPALNKAASQQMFDAILAAKAEGDSLGGVVEVVCTNAPVGLGAPWFDGVEAVLAKQFFSIPAVKGVEFGAGFAAATMHGSQYNDPYQCADGKVQTVSNNAGGLLGGLTNGMPITARVAFRPTPSISKAQQSISLSALQAGNEAAKILEVKGRHDPCVAVRGVPVVESAMAVGLLELWLERNGDQSLTGGIPHAEK
ncbi:MAG: chorismate synthase [Clostridiales bacterium]|nr:chorismate synthase [Clostridiales bacterium]